MTASIVDQETRLVECLWSEQDQDACRMCSGEVCALCGAGCWNNAVGFTEPPCEHDVTERHQEFVVPGALVSWLIRRSDRWVADGDGSMKMWVIVGQSEPGAVLGDRLTMRQRDAILADHPEIDHDHLRRTWWAQREASPRAARPAAKGSES